MNPLDTPRFCPRCGRSMSGEGPPVACAGASCDFVWYANPKVATGVVVEDDRGRILLVRRNHEPAYGRWAFPSGFVDAGEVVEEAAVREVFEETGVEVRLDALLGVYSERGNPVVFVAYAGAVTAGEAAAGDEALEVGYFEPGALPEMPFPHDDSIVEAWLAHRALAHPTGGEVA